MLILNSKGTVLHRITSFLVHHKQSLNFSGGKDNSKADSILKNYFNLRMDMTNKSMIQMLDRIKELKLTSSFFKDHRWVHLNVTIQRNMPTFTTQDKLSILQSLTKMNYFNDAFINILRDLCGKIDKLTDSQKANLLYYMAKSQNVRLDAVKNICDSLLISIDNEEYKKSFYSNVKNSKQKDSKQQKQTSLFDDNESSSFSQQIGSRDLILCLWSLWKMKVKDQLLTTCIIKSYLKPTIQFLPTKQFPLLLSTLWLHNLHRKRLFSQVSYQLTKRESTLVELDRDKLIMLCCMLCKPLIGNQEEIGKQTANLVLWLMETLYLRRQNEEDVIYSSALYKVLLNASQAGIMDVQLYQKYIAFIAEDLTKIQLKQVVYLLAIIQKIRGPTRAFRRRSGSEQPPICQKQLKILNTYLVERILRFLNRIDEAHPARAVLRNLTISNFIAMPTNIRKKLILQQRNLSAQDPGQRKEKSEEDSTLKKKKEKQSIGTQNISQTVQ